MFGFSALLVQGIMYFALMGMVFRARHRVGLGVFFCLLGTMHFLETYLAATFFIELPFGLISPGSTVMFTGKLAFFLLLYMKEDAEAMRQPIYGLLSGNVLMIVLGLILRLSSTPANLPGYNPDLGFIDQMGLLMVWGTVVLYIDLIAMIILYERLGKLVRNTFLLIFISLAIILSFDQAAFWAGLHILTGVPTSAFYGGWIAKVGAAAFFAAALAFYLRFVERSTLPVRARGAVDVFDRLTYRHRYEILVEQVGKDALTGLQDRGEFDNNGPIMLQTAARLDRRISLLMIDIDHFKAINDSHGHVVGDGVIRDVAQMIAGQKREGDHVFRYGGEEFALLSTEMPDGAVALAERIRSVVADSEIADLGHAVTISIGIATFPARSISFRDLLIRADAALYAAKMGGRNRVASASNGEGRTEAGKDLVAENVQPPA
jgi:diguanylate cyclase (GGDEF)-like protein